MKNWRSNNTGGTLYSLKPLQPLAHVSLDVIFDVILIDSWLDLQDKIAIHVRKKKMLIRSYFPITY